MKVSTPKQHTVFLEDENIMLRKLRTAVSREFALQSIGKAYQRLEDHYDKVPRFYISEQEQREEFKRKHPDSKNLQFPPLPTGIAMQEQMDPITQDEIKSIILRIKKGKSSGDDGLTGSHLKYLVYQHEHFLKILEFFFNQLLSNPAHLQDCKQLFRFRAILLPKKSGGLRPVSCESMILAVFSSCLKTRLMQQVDIHEHQFCFKSGGITHALAGLNNSKFRAKRQPQPIVQTRKLQTMNEEVKLKLKLENHSRLDDTVCSLKGSSQVFQHAFETFDTSI
ncbi:Putative_reverse transcriptase/endonuclease [Hexamita inflata]|uniref:Reverse transcriptase/endonuclease n=1 Tax=Hexamita inflata TaxID=28002 RepID=A0AA86U814_9EUKA|nr:Putative reverse transcriptase/endonuclease [Hexamita inflata]